MTDCFNPEPIMLRNPTSLLVDDKKQHQPYQPEIIEVAQHLAPEQFQYEFPPKSRIMAIEASDLEDEDFSFFDECSFTTTSTSTAAYSNILYEEDEENDDDDEQAYYHHKIPDIDSLLLNDNSERLLNQYFDSFDTNEDDTNTMSFIADSQLSPLQLPTQANYDSRHIREESYDSTGTIVLRKISCKPARPSSFLSSVHLSSTHTQQYLSRVAEEDRINWDETSFIFPDYSNSYLDHQKVYRSVHPYHCSRMGSEAEIFCQDDSGSLNEDEISSNFSNNSKVVVMKISKTHVAPPTFITYCQTAGSYISADEGYDDEDDEYNPCKELPIESASVFLPLSDQEQERLARLDNHRQLAAIKIQSVWRGYKCRKETKTSSLKLSHRVLAGLAQVNDSIHRRNNNQLQDRIYMLEQRLGEETSMRIAFEKAMEDMTVVMDHQHHVLHDRVEQEVSMRQTYERKMEQMMAQVQPLESRLRHESKARADLESMMSRVLDQLHDMKVQVKEEAEQRKELQRKLDSAVEELAVLKQSRKQQPTTTRSVRSISTSRNVSSVTQQPQQRSISRLSTVSTVAGRNSPLPLSKASNTPISSSRRVLTPSVRSTTPRLSNRPTDTIAAKRSTTATPTLRKTIINRKS